jgi:multidrug resistance efflux pump
VIALIAICYASLYFLVFNKLGLLKKSIGNIAAFAGVGVAIIGVVVFMWYTFAPMTVDARMFRFIIPIVPNVKGQVLEVPVQATQDLSRGDILFTIDPAPYQFAVRELEAQVQQQEADRRLAQINVDRAARLVKTQAAAQIDLDIWTAKLDAATAAIQATRARLDSALWQLGETTVRAPNDGYILNLQLRPGGYVTPMPMASPMAFVSTEANAILATFSQSAMRRIAVGNQAEVVFTSRPGETFSGKVVRVVGFGGQSQLTASSLLPTFTGAPVSDRWGVLIELDDQQVARELPQGAGGTLAVYTDKGAPLHVISKVALRIQAWLGFLTTP